MTAASAANIAVEICRSCQVFWFDEAEHAKAPIRPVRGTRTLPQDALERIGRQQAILISKEYNSRYGGHMSVADALPLVPGVAGLPLEAEARGLTRYPWATWAIGAILTGLGLWALGYPDDASGYGLIATDIDRLGGATFVTALFVHSTLFQLATNVYFLLIFGDNVEDFLGPAVFLLLLLTGGLIGNALHALFDADNPAVLMSGSGAVSAVTLFYALRFPTARLRYIRLLRWHTMPASAGLLFWFIAKLFSTQSFLGRAEPSTWPYVGGALAGLVFWLTFREPGEGPFGRS